MAKTKQEDMPEQESGKRAPRSYSGAIDDASDAIADDYQSSLRSVETLARDIYLRIITGPSSVASTAEHLVNRAFERAEAFYKIAESKRSQRGK